ncbi:MAG: VWA domain-containing protein [Acidobacteria bacterium]|nr:VWA domain-containing protein [Acidobacteriota bacterium]
MGARTDRLTAVLAAATIGVAGSIGVETQSVRQPRVFRSGVDLVRFSVAVTDSKGKLVRGLAASDFTVLEDGRPQTITFFAAGDAGEAKPPMHVGLLFDTSESMIDDLRFSKNAAVKFLRGMPDAVDVTFVDFDTEVRVARYGQNDFPRLVERIRSTHPQGFTALYDALGVYLDGASSQDGDKVLVIYTDGGDTRSNVMYGDVLEMLRASDVTAFSVGLLENQSASVKMDQRMRLQDIAAVTGGMALFPTSADQLDEMYARIAEEIEARYSLGYLSTNTKTDGAWRKVEIKLLRPHLKNVRLRTRPGYYAPYRAE